MRDWHTDAPRVPLSDERMDQIVEEALAAQEAADVALTRDVISGARCSCCDAPMPPGPPGRECNDCQNI